MRKVALASLAALIAIFSTGPANAADPGKTQLTIGTSVGDFGDMVRHHVKPQLEKQGYKVKLIEFSDYVTPNMALSEGAIDANIFQHKPYLDDFSRARGLKLAPVFQVPTAPLGLYSGRSKRLDEAKGGTRVAVPNDPSNLARSLVLLQELKWVRLKPGTNALTASVRDIQQNVKGIRIVQLEAAQIPRTRRDVDFAVINGNYATSSGIKLTEALFTEKNDRFVNWGVVRQADRARPWVKDLSAAFNSAQFKAWAKPRYTGYRFPTSWK